MTETGVREEICRLGRSLFERGLAGAADQCIARLARPGAAIAARRRRPARLRRRPDQGSAAAYRAVPDAPRRARGGASAFDAFGGAVDAAGDRSAPRIAADDAILSDALRPDRAAAVLAARDWKS